MKGYAVMATKQQIPALAGSIVSKQEGFSVLSNEDAQWAIENTEEAIRLACEAIRTRNNGANTEPAPAPAPKHSIPSDTVSQLVKWKQLYEEVLGFEKAGYDEMPLPAATTGFGWLVVVKKGITIEAVIKALKTKMKVYRYTDNDLDEAVPTNERTADHDYAITVRDQVEPDNDLRNTSAAQIAKKNPKLPTMTLLERLLLELFYFHFTGEHLDIKGVTICAGSRDSGGRVPGVFWDPGSGGLYIDGCDAGNSDDDYGARAVQVTG